MRKYITSSSLKMKYLVDANFNRTTEYKSSGSESNTTHHMNPFTSLTFLHFLPSLSYFPS